MYAPTKTPRFWRGVIFSGCDGLVFFRYRPGWIFKDWISGFSDFGFFGFLRIESLLHKVVTQILDKQGLSKKRLQT